MIIIVKVKYSCKPSTFVMYDVMSGSWWYMGYSVLDSGRVTFWYHNTMFQCNGDGTWVIVSWIRIR